MKVLLSWPVDKDLSQAISDAANQAEALREMAHFEMTFLRNEEEWFERCEEASVMLNPRISLPRYPEFLRRAQKLEMIQTSSIGYDHIDIAACTVAGVIVCNVAEIMAEITSQHVWAIILDISKNVTRSDRFLRGAGWLSPKRFGIGLYGKTLGIIGLGDIGGRVAVKGSLAFGMKVLAYDPYVLPEHAQLYNAHLVDLETLLRESDVVSINCPLTSETRHLLGPQQLRLLKPTAILVNAARGGIVDENALIEVLRKEEIFGAGLDVFENEPLSSTSPLRKLENVVLTPHIGSSTEEAFNSTWKAAVENILRYIKGERPYWIVNPSAVNARRLHL